MTEDEAFIRSVVDSQGDDTPRLVYADWLDDRGDPRGAYLRAERAAVVTGDVARLRELAAGLDPVWVARVSLPPVGVCLERAKLTERGPLSSAAEIREAERRIGAAFPDDYRAFLLNYNGGWVGDFPTFELPNGGIVWRDEQGWRLHPVNRVHRFTIRPDDLLRDGGRDLLPRLAETVEGWLSHYVVIGLDPDLIGGIFLGVSGPDRGYVRVLDTSVEIEVSVRFAASRPPMATTLAEFLSVIPAHPVLPISPPAAPRPSDIPI